MELHRRAFLSTGLAATLSGCWWDASQKANFEVALSYRLNGVEGENKFVRAIEPRFSPYNPRVGVTKAFWSFLSMGETPWIKLSEKGYVFFFYGDYPLGEMGAGEKADSKADLVASLNAFRKSSDLVVKGVDIFRMFLHVPDMGDFGKQDDGPPSELLGKVPALSDLKVYLQPTSYPMTKRVLTETPVKEAVERYAKHPAGNGEAQPRVTQLIGFYDGDYILEKN